MQAKIRLFKVLVSLSIFSSCCLGLTVNQLNGGANVIYIDFSIPGTVLPLELIRSYNSITAINESTGWNGAFGWGWTAPFETTLTTTPERHVLLRDGSTGNTVIFKPLTEDPNVKKRFFSEVKRSYFEQEKRRKLTDDELSKLQLPTSLLSKLESDPRFRAEIALRYGIASEVPQGGLYVSSEYGYQTIQFKNNQWIREKDGIRYYFDKEGRLIRQIDKNGYYFTFDYFKNEPNHLLEIRSQERDLSLKFQWRNNHVAEVTDNRNRIARYFYDERGNLSKVVDSNNQTYLYQYLDPKFPHLLTRIDYPNESSGDKVVHRKMRYDKNGLVVYHRDKDGTEIEYSFGRGATDPENHFWTKTITKRDGKNEERSDEFFIQQRSDGSKFLYKQVTVQSGITTTTTYNNCCGQPEQITRNGVVTNFKYYSDGLLKEKNGPKEEVRIEYDPRWKKITKISQNDFQSRYTYDNRGNLVEASNSRKEKVSLKYDHYGRIAAMIDNQSRSVSFKYGDHGKPTRIEQKGVGSIQIDYDNEGRIRNTATVVETKGKRKPSHVKSQEVIQQVMKSFQHLLDIIRPAGVSFNGA